MENTKFAKFLTIGVLAIAALGLGKIGIERYEASNIEEAKTYITTTGATVAKSAQDYQDKTDKLYKQANTRLEVLKKEEKLLSAIGIPVSVQSLKTQLDSTYQLSKQNLDYTVKTHKELNDLISSPEKAKEFAYNDDKIEAFKQQAIKNDTDFQKLVSLNNSIATNLNAAKGAKEQIVKTIRERVQTANLEQAGEVFKAQAKSSINADKAEIAKIKTDNEMAQEIGAKDLADMEQSLNEMEQAAFDTVLEDKELVAKLVAQGAQDPQKLEEAILASLANPEPSSTTTTVVHNHNGGGMSFAETWLMYHWLSAGSSSSYSSSATGSSFTNSTSAMALNNGTKGLYDYKNPTSQISKKIDSPDLAKASAKQQMAMKRMANARSMIAAKTTKVNSVKSKIASQRASAAASRSYSSGARSSGG